MFFKYLRKKTYLLLLLMPLSAPIHHISAKDICRNIFSRKYRTAKLIPELVNIKLPTLKEAQRISAEAADVDGQFSAFRCSCKAYNGVKKFFNTFMSNVQLLESKTSTTPERTQARLELTSLLSNPLLKDASYLNITISSNAVYHYTIGSTIAEAWFNFVGAENYPAMRAFLKAQPFDVNVGNRNRATDTALHYAAENGKMKLLKLLLKHPDINIHAGGMGGDTPVQHATRAGHAELVRVLANRPEASSNTSPLDSALKEAAKQGRADIVEILLEAGADVNGTDLGSSGTALIYAALAESGHAAVVKLLNAPEILVNKTIKYGDVLLEANEAGTALIAAARHDLKTLKTLLADSRIDILTRNHADETVLTITTTSRTHAFPIILDTLTARGLRISDADLEIILYRLFVGSIERATKSEDNIVWTALVKNGYVKPQDGLTSLAQQIIIQSGFNLTTQSKLLGATNQAPSSSPLKLFFLHGTKKDIALLLEQETIPLPSVGEIVSILNGSKVHDNLLFFLKHRKVRKHLSVLVQSALAMGKPGTPALKFLLELRPLPKEIRRGLADALPAKPDYLEIGLSDTALRALSPTSYLREHKIRLNQFDTVAEFQAHLKTKRISKKAVDLAFDLVQREEVSLFLLDAAALHPNLRTVENSAQLLIWATHGNFTAEQMIRLSAMTRSDFYSLIIQLSRNNQMSESSWKFFAQNLFEKANIQQFMEFLILLDAVYKLENYRQDHSVALEQVLSELTYGKEITPETLPGSIAKARESVLEKVNQLLSIKESSFDIQAYQKLEREWGDLTPIWVLLARLRGLSNRQRKDFSQVIPIIRDIFLYSIQGRFAEYKFRGITDEQITEVNRQLSPLTQKERTLWEEAQIIVRPGQGQLSPSAMWETQQQAIRDTIRANVTPNWKEARKNIGQLVTKDISEGVKSANWETIILEFTGSLNAFIKERGVQTAADQITVLDRMLKTMQKYIDKPQDLKKITATLKLLLVALKKEHSNAEVFLDQTISDLKEIETRLNVVNRVSSSESVLIASVKTADPRLLMVIGDAVKGCSSCQSYSTGGQIYTLPGYVIDANIQALMSYALKAKDFQKGDFLKINNWLEVETDVQITFNGNLQRFRFERADEVIESRSLETASLRNILKLGHLESSPETSALFLERDYSQPSDFLHQMRQQHQDLLTNLADSIGAELSGTITVPASRSPSGHYSDASGGSRIKDYTVEIQ